MIHFKNSKMKRLQVTAALIATMVTISIRAL